MVAAAAASATAAELVLCKTYNFIYLFIFLHFFHHFDFHEWKSFATLCACVCVLRKNKCARRRRRRLPCQNKMDSMSSFQSRFVVHIQWVDATSTVAIVHQVHLDKLLQFMCWLLCCVSVCVCMVNLCPKFVRSPNGFLPKRMAQADKKLHEKHV